YNHVHQTTLESEDILLSLDLKPQAIVLAANGHAGDSGNPIAVAYRNAPYHLPWERYLAVGIRDLIDQIYQDGGAVPRGTQLRSGIEKIEGLRADGKIGVDAIYEGSNLQKIDCITIAVEHEEVSLSALRTNLVGVVRGYLDIQQECHEKSLGNPEIVVNAAGPWCHGGWKVDEGSREAKSYRDGFGTYGVMEDSFSGEDPTKPSGTGTFLARYIAVQIVAQNLADFARVALRYTIGREDVGLNITTNGTGRVSQEVLERWTRAELPLNIGTAIERFDLRNPALYGAIVKSSDFFQNPEFPWNRGDFTPFQMPRQ
ncbi:methionine adenosyltransferase domain-containing protein, partial [Candidatus Woesearchaeota archaeon]|nr:methionine adenosyltransferase domain-containing protein [Candidatus Woesearchaeota archaeon]